MSEFDVAVNVTSGSESGSRASVGRRRRPEETHVEEVPAARLRGQGSQDNLLKNHPKLSFLQLHGSQNILWRKSTIVQSLYLERHRKISAKINVAFLS